MIDVRVASRYAQAIFNTAKAGGALKVVEEDLNGIAATLQADPRLRRYLLDPTVGKTEKQELLARACAAAHPITLSALRLLLEKGREAEFEGVRLKYVELRQRHEQVANLVITSAEPMDEDQRRALILKLTKSIGRTIEAEFRVDPKLLGGVTVAFDNTVLDGSLKGALGKIKERIFRDALIQN